MDESTLKSDEADGPRDAHGRLPEPGSITTISGVYINPTKARPEQITPYDIAHALSLVNRYAGHSLFAYSVAQHSVLLHDFIRNRASYQNGTYRIMPAFGGEQEFGVEIRKQALMHDATEGYIADIGGPFKFEFPDYLRHEAQLNAVIAERFSISPDHHPWLKFLDKAITNNEMEVLAKRGSWSAKYRALGFLPGVTIEQWTPEYARARFLSCFRALWPHETVSL